MAVDAAGRVYAADYAHDRVMAYTNSGADLYQLGSSGNGNGQFWSPHGVTVDAVGNIYVIEASGDRIQVFGELPTPAQSSTWGRVKARYRN